AAEVALKEADTHRGFCVVLGVGDGQLAYEIARRSEFFVLALDTDPDRVARAREKLTAAGVYGKRVVVHHVPEDELAYADCFANLVVSGEAPEGGNVPYAPQAVLRMVQPYGGTLLLRAQALDRWSADGLSEWREITRDGATFHVARRGALERAGEWSHLYANPANTACSNDRLVGTDLCIQWFGPPGAEDVVDRHRIAMAPLFKDGKLFYAGLYNTLQAIDAYNGTRLWKVDVPGSVRKLISHNAGFVCAGEGHVFITSEKTCRVLDASSGETVHLFEGLNADTDWGHVSVQGECLLGSSQKPEVSRMAAAGLRDFVNARISKSRVAVSENLFAINHRKRELLWSYTGGVILSPTITISGDTVYFAESRNETCLNDPTGTADMRHFVATDAWLVALELESGKERWRKPIPPNTDEAQWIMYLSYADGILLSTRTYWLHEHLTYELRTMDAATGQERWTQLVKSPVSGPYAPLINGKNAQAAHPSIVGGKIYWLAHTFGTIFCHDLRTGETAHNPEFGKGWQNKGCAPPTASGSALYYRDTSCHMYDLATRRRHDLTKVTRPGCWMSIIPAGGLVLMPEASSGCTCGFALQMSVALAPAGRAVTRDEGGRISSERVLP
ncbi:MAG: PQQ-binding-like beta-propeller repeat protein, partial [Armatimonadota bacterium]